MLMATMNDPSKRFGSPYATPDWAVELPKNVGWCGTKLFYSLDKTIYRYDAETAQTTPFFIESDYMAWCYDHHVELSAWPLTMVHPSGASRYLILASEHHTLWLDASTADVVMCALWMGDERLQRYASTRPAVVYALEGRLHLFDPLGAFALPADKSQLEADDGTNEPMVLEVATAARHLSFGGDAWQIAPYRAEWGMMDACYWSPDDRHLLLYATDDRHLPLHPYTDEHGTVLDPAEGTRYPFAGEVSERVALWLYEMELDAAHCLANPTAASPYFLHPTWDVERQCLYLTHLDRSQRLAVLYSYALDDLRRAPYGVYRESHQPFLEPRPPYLLASGALLWITATLSGTDSILYRLDPDAVAAPQRIEHLVPLPSCAEAIDEVVGSPDGNILYVMGRYGLELERIIARYDLSAGDYHEATLSRNRGRDDALCSQCRYVQGVWTNASQSHCAALTVWGMNEARLELVDLATDATTTLWTLEDSPIYPIVERCDNRSVPVPLPSHPAAPTILLGRTLAANQHTLLNTRTVLPPHFDAARRYPAVYYVYGGPHVQMITGGLHSGVRPIELHLASLGYVVFAVDPRGSDGRELGFVQSMAGHLGSPTDADLLFVLEELKQCHYVDPTRLYLHGWSFGGFMALRLALRHPEAFAAVVAGGAVVDWSFYEVMYTERYMSTPAQNADGYAENRILTGAHKLRIPLLLIHGGRDEVVLPMHHHRLVEALAGNPHLATHYFPDQGHNMAGKARTDLFGRIVDFLHRHA